jgi:hypothetical protein
MTNFLIINKLNLMNNNLMKTKLSNIMAMKIKNLSQLNLSICTKILSH